MKEILNRLTNYETLTEKEASDKEKGFAVGADIYLVKPVQKDELQEKLRMLLEDN